MFIHVYRHYFFADPKTEYNISKQLKTSQFPFYYIPAIFCSAPPPLSPFAVLWEGKMAVCTQLHLLGAGEGGLPQRLSQTFKLHLAQHPPWWTKFPMANCIHTAVSDQ